MASFSRPDSFAEKIAASREERAAFCESMAAQHPGTPWAVDQLADAAEWRAAAERARAGDRSPYWPS